MPYAAKELVYCYIGNVITIKWGVEEASSVADLHQLHSKAPRRALPCQ